MIETRFEFILEDGAIDRAAVTRRAHSLNEKFPDKDFPHWLAYAWEVARGKQRAYRKAIENANTAEVALT